MKWLPKVEPNHCGSKRDKHHTEDVDQFRTMFVIVMVMMVIAVVTIVGMGKLRQVNPCFGDLAEIFRAVVSLAIGIVSPNDQLKYLLTTAINSSAASSCEVSALAGGGSKWKRTSPSINPAISPFRAPRQEATS
jgi:hypothetical protein